MAECRLNNYLLLHIHKEITDSLDLIAVATEFIDSHVETLSSKLEVNFCVERSLVFINLFVIKVTVSMVI